MDSEKLIKEAIKHLLKFQGKTFIVKASGRVLADSCFEQVMENIVFLATCGIKMVFVFGAGVQIDSALSEAGIKTEKIDGRRITSPEAMPIIISVVERELQKIFKVSRKINRSLRVGTISHLSRSLGENFGLSGTPYALLDMSCRKLRNLNSAYGLNVVGPVGSMVFSQRKSFPNVSNCNADDVALLVAEKLSAEKMIFLSDVNGVLGKDEKIISRIRKKEIGELISSGIVFGGMIPKLQAAAKVVSSGVKACHVVSYQNVSLLTEILTAEGTGTMITA